jgi:hypothetical protein
VTFSAESACYGGNGHCSLRILVGDQEAQPASGLDFAFDSTNSGHERSSSKESHAMQRSRCLVHLEQPQDATIRVQWAVSDPRTTFRLDDWHLTENLVAVGLTECPAP